MTVALSLIALIAFTILCAASFLIVAHLPMPVHRGAQRHGRYANLALEHGLERTSSGTVRLVQA